MGFGFCCHMIVFYISTFQGGVGGVGGVGGAGGVGVEAGTGWKRRQII